MYISMQILPSLLVNIVKSLIFWNQFRKTGRYESFPNITYKIFSRATADQFLVEGQMPRGGNGSRQMPALNKFYESGSFSPSQPHDTNSLHVSVYFVS